MCCCCLRKLVSFPATVAAAASPVTSETWGVFLKFGALCWDELSRSGNKEAKSLKGSESRVMTLPCIRESERERRGEKFC